MGRGRVYTQRHSATSFYVVHPGTNLSLCPITKYAPSPVFFPDTVPN